MNDGVFKIELEQRTIQSSYSHLDYFKIDYIILKPEGIREVMKKTDQSHCILKAKTRSYVYLFTVQCSFQITSL